MEYRSIWTGSPLREDFSRYCRAAADPRLSLKNILLVGAEIDNKVEDRLSFNDQDYLYRSLYMLHHMNIPVSPDFTLNIVNLHQGQDFLTDDFDADLVIACHIMGDLGGSIISPGMEMSEEFMRSVTMSPHAQKRGVWHNSAKRSGAQVVVALGDGCEISEQDFMGDHYFAAARQEAIITTGHVLLNDDYASMLHVASRTDPVRQIPKAPLPTLG